MSAILQANDVHKTYRRGDDAVHALAGLSMTIQAGEFVAIMGASGSGKSTLLHLAGGLDTPSRGTIIVEGRELTRLSDRERTVFRRRRIGVVFQSFNLMHSLSTRENIALPMLLNGEPLRAIDAKVQELLDVVHLRGRTEHRPQALSGGEQQRVAVARALMLDPALILADEPTGNLDSKNAIEIWQLLRSLSTTHGKTILMVTHEAQAAAYADRVCVMRDGHLVGEFHPHEAHDAALVAAEYQKLAG